MKFEHSYLGWSNFTLFSLYRGQKVRQIGISLGDFRPANDYQFSLFEEPLELNQQITLESSIDKIRKKLGYSSLVRASSLQTGGTAIYHSHLVVGHDGGQTLTPS